MIAPWQDREKKARRQDGRISFWISFDTDDSFKTGKDSNRDLGSSLPALSFCLNQSLILNLFNQKTYLTCDLIRGERKPLANFLKSSLDCLILRSKQRAGQSGDREKKQIERKKSRRQQFDSASRKEASPLFVNSTRFGFTEEDKFIDSPLSLSNTQVQ